MITQFEADIIVKVLTTRGKVVLPFEVSRPMMDVLKAIAAMKNVLHSMDDDISELRKKASAGGKVIDKNFFRWRKCFSKMPNVKKGQEKQYLVKLKDDSITTDILFMDGDGKKRWKAHGYDVVKWCKIPSEEQPEEQKD